MKFTPRVYSNNRNWGYLGSWNLYHNNENFIIACHEHSVSTYYYICYNLSLDKHKFHCECNSIKEILKKVQENNYD